jgi:hypothetical protein
VRGIKKENGRGIKSEINKGVTRGSRNLKHRKKKQYIVHKPSRLKIVNSNECKTPLNAKIEAIYYLIYDYCMALILRIIGANFYIYPL